MYVGIGADLTAAQMAEMTGLSPEEVQAMAQSTSGGGGDHGATVSTFTPAPSSSVPAAQTSQVGVSRAALTFGGVLVVGLLVAGAAYVFGQKR